MSPSSHINYHCQVLPVSILLKILTQLQSNCNEMQLDNRYKSDFPQKSLMFAAPKPSWKYWPASLQSTIKVIPHRSKSLWNGKKITIIIKKKKNTYWIWVIWCGVIWLRQTPCGCFSTQCTGTDFLHFFIFMSRDHIFLGDVLGTQQQSPPGLDTLTEILVRTDKSTLPCLIRFCFKILVVFTTRMLNRYAGASNIIQG